MPMDGKQSSFQFRSRRRPVNYDDDDTPPKVNSEKNKESMATLVPSDRSGNHTNATQQHQNMVNKLMADAFLGTVAGRLAQEIHDEFLVCKICFESYTNPKCLTCLHTFCAQCIERHISAEVTYNKYTDYRDFTCPLCRKRTQLPLGGIKRLPDNFLISGLTELVMRQRAPSHSSSSATLTAGQSARGYTDGLDTTSSSVNGDEDHDHINALPRFGRRGAPYGECEICSQVGANDRGRSTEPQCTGSALNTELTGRASSAHLSNAPQASAKCLDCNKLLCSDCLDRHRTTKVTKDHATFDLQSGNTIECKDHAGESVRFYCEACSMCICVLCTFNEHREHEVTSFGEAVTTLRSQLSDSLADTSRRIAHAQTRIGMVGEVAELVHNLERQIHDTADQFIDVINKQKQEILHDLHEFIGVKHMEAIDQNLDQEQQLETAEAIYQDVAKYLEGQEIDMLLAKPDLCNKMIELRELSLDDGEFDHISSEVYFRPGTVQLGYLTNDMSGPPTDHYDYIHLPLSSSQSSIELANRPCVNTTSCQTDITLLEKFLAKEKPKEDRPVRSRACNTEPAPTMDQETNTRPRGVHTVISFTDVASNANSEEFLAQLDSSKLDFQSMDNLTRARMRRKLREHGNTFDAGNGLTLPETNGLSRNSNRGSSDFALRRYSAIDKSHYNHYNH